MPDANAQPLDIANARAGALGSAEQHLASAESFAAQKQYAMNIRAGRERELRIQVLGLAVGAKSGDPVQVAKEFWAFITAGDPAD